MAKSQLALWCCVIGIELHIIAIVSISLYSFFVWPFSTLVPVRNDLSLVAALLTTNLELVIIIISLASTEWLKTRYTCIVASCRHWLNGPELSNSRLLLLPPEIRLRIWEELVPRTRCARGDTRVTVVYRERELWDSAVVKLLTFLRLISRNRTIMYPRIPVEFLRTCRQNREEGHHFFYGTSTFYFDNPCAVYHFINGRSLSRQNTIRHLEFTVSSGWYLRTEDFQGKPYVDGINSPALRASQIPSIIKKLRNLRTLNINTSPYNHLIDVRCYARSIYQFLRNVQASEAVTVKLDLRCCVNRQWYPYRTMQWQWRSNCQKQFATAAWRLIRNPNSRIPVAVQTEQVVQSKYTLVAMVLVQQE